MFSTLNVFEFQRQFTEAKDCLAYLARLKWKEGYQCLRCGCKDYTKGYQSFARRCKDCRYDESATAHTLFHNLKFNLLKAFYGVFRYCKKKGISSYELAKEIGVSQPTAWLFHCKLQQAMQSSGDFPLTGEVHIDEYVTGGTEPGKPGRSDGKKKKTLIMVEVRDGNKTGRVYCQQIKNYKKKTLYPIIEAKVATDAGVITDEYPSYDKLKEKFPKAKQRKSAKGETFLVVHNQIMNMKSWLRGIHHKCSQKHYQKYLDEYCFRTNRRNTEQGIFRAIMLRVTQSKTKPFKELTAYAA
ncbi:MAG: IS1595 family transposase [Ginsengibacter sp.]